MCSVEENEHRADLNLRARRESLPGADLDLHARWENLPGADVDPRAHWERLPGADLRRRSRARTERVESVDQGVVAPPVPWRFSPFRVR